MSAVLGTQVPVIVEDASFEVGRFLRFPGEIVVEVGGLVEPSSPIGSESAGAGRTITLYLARELGIDPGTVARYITKPLGSHFEAGESVARARKGLRTLTCDTSEAGRLSEINEIAGTATIIPETESQALESLVHGEVASVVDGLGAFIRAGGTRIRGAIALGADNTGPIKIAVEGHDRELTTDGVTEDLHGMIVLGGMTVSAAAIRKLSEIGARGVIVGSISERDVRRVAASGEQEPPAQAFWRAWATNGPLAPDLERRGLTIFVTEGFGRRPMASTIFSVISEREGQSASVVIPGRESPFPSYPYLCFTSAEHTHANPVTPISPVDGVVARLIDPQHMGTVVTCRSEPAIQMGADGQRRVVVEIEQTDNMRRVVQLCNLELLKNP